MQSAKQLLLSVDGRIGRRTFLIAAAGLTVANVFLGLVPFFGPMLVLPLLWPFACITAKRLHDGGRSGWPAVVVAAMCLAVGAIAAAIGVMATDPALALSAFAAAGLVLMLGGLTTLAGLALLVFALLLGSDPGTNRFGAPEIGGIDLDALLQRGRP